MTMNLLSHSSKPIGKPKFPTWAVLEPGNLPSAIFAQRALGSIIPHSALYQPTTDYILPSDYDLLNKIFASTGLEPLKVEDAAVTTFIGSVDGHELKAQLSKIFNVRTHDLSTGQVTIESRSVYTYSLMNPPKIFEELKNDVTLLSELKKKLKRDGGIADMVVGVKTCVGAHLNYTRLQKGGTDAQLGIPINEIIAALGGPPIPIDINASASANFEKIRQYVADHDAKGERLFALQYKRIMTVKRWREQEQIEMKDLEVFENGLFAAGDEDDNNDDEDDLVLCPFGELPHDAMTM